ncbi:UDP-N-acetylglucosamine--N-acetylmuramyl-(pentapeptide) pyrophosphoryl-undecaprenol N-acetylglucosamine transferase [Candidatus Parcubacteria bacterium]|nr:UDP-N-acetylglucosamine--N-acetylmuramyl-(pentapeptide) pyrophosphoryl-undecaprenol N-acetylglucosamine transferase [Candidatus Parcubacteria bacterium]
MLTYNKKNVKILLTGGGTGGSVAPLLAVVEELCEKGAKPPIGGLAPCDFLWLGTKCGHEKQMVENARIKFKPIFSGKFRRYFSLRNFIDPFFILAGFFQAFFIILKWKPDLVMSAGSFVSVPVVWAAWLLRVPVLIHQQDARPGLANKLMAPFASVITVTFEKSLKDYGKKAIWIGNFIRNEFINYKINKREARQKLNLNNEKPAVLIIGGGTGAVVINKLVEQSLNELIKFCQIIHITGKGKGGLNIANKCKNYHPFEFMHIDGLIKAFTASDAVISRCGMGVLTELSYLAKPAILISMPDSHQEENAEIFKEKGAAIVLDQKKLTGEILVDNIRKLLGDKILRDKLSENISHVIKRGANEEIREIINDILKK